MLIKCTNAARCESDGVSKRILLLYWDMRELESHQRQAVMRLISLSGTSSAPEIDQEKQKINQRADSDSITYDKHWTNWSSGNKWSSKVWYLCFHQTCMIQIGHAGHGRETKTSSQNPIQPPGRVAFDACQVFWGRWWVRFMFNDREIKPFNNLYLGTSKYAYKWFISFYIILHFFSSFKVSVDQATWNLSLFFCLGF